ncbi:hypothetical protein [Sulfuracidifex tepidarius]|uniref:Uncharacterized protein n=1 Tax=Sulfuracidifex tepidarius TaxID=1294262 RepID=A0A510DYK8_9CREN|nr:hypothetical protein [Sulfuracidifex tepidarius]BBG25316.1 hypothetical protein IC006_2651 [Sulfuracidifex tepidarius]BBG28110.1 hypothetical protein IC007_2665 [Sulfuracidifex tepidarius]
MDEQLIEILLILGLSTFPLLMAAWVSTYRKLIRGGLEYVGENYNDRRIIVPPSKSVTVHVSGKCVLLSEGMNSWFTIRMNNGVRQRVFKIRLMNTEGDLTIINESRTMPLNLVIRCEA